MPCKNEHVLRGRAAIINTTVTAIRSCISNRLICLSFRAKRACDFGIPNEIYSLKSRRCYRRGDPVGQIIQRLTFRFEIFIVTRSSGP